MIKPKKNSFIFAFFSWYIGHIIKKDFSSFNFNKVDFDTPKSILLLANHFSWWDGFLMFYLNKLYFKKEFHVMILEETAKKQWFMKNLGAFSVQKNSRSIFESLDFAASLLNNPKNLVLIFPQGRLHQANVKEIIFESGLKRILNKASNNFQFIFSVTFIRYFDKRKPAVKTHLLNWQNSETASLKNIQQAFNTHYLNSVVEQEKQDTE